MKNFKLYVILTLNKRGFMTGTKENSHANHRQRLKQKVRKYGIDCLANHEVLEYFLFYSIPRKDTNGIAHNLITRFGSFSKVLDADYEDLLKVDGVGKESALLIKSLSSIIDVYKRSKAQEKKTVIYSHNDSIKYFRDNFEVKRKEYMVLTCLSKSNIVLKNFVCDGKDETEITFELRRIANQINDEGVCSVILYHTHPNGEVTPSFADIDATQKIVNICLVNGIDFKDHVIFNEAEHYSFNNNGLITDMKEQYKKMFSATQIYSKALKNNKK